MKWSLEDFDLRSIIKDIFRNLWVVILAGITAFMGITALYSLNFKPEYTSTATLSVTLNTNNDRYAALGLTKDMTSIFKEVFKSEALRKKICEDMGVTEIDGNIDIELINETNLINLKVVSETSQNTYRIINSALKNYDTISDYLFSNAKLEVLKLPSVPYTPSNIYNVGSVRNLGVLASIVLTVLLIGFISFIRPTVKNEKSAKRQLEGRCIGTIPFVHKYQTKKERFKQMLGMDVPNKAILITSVMLGMPFIESVKKTATSIQHHLKHNKSKTLMVTSVAENEGKSSVASNIALSLAEKGNKVILVDCDLKKPALYQIFDKEKVEGSSLSDYLNGTKTADEITEKINGNLNAIYQYSGVRNSSIYVSGDEIKKLFAELKTEYDCIVVDTPPMALSTDAEIILGNVDSAVITVRQDWADVEAVNDAIEVIRQSECNFAGYILNATEVSKIKSNSYNYNYNYNYSYGLKDKSSNESKEG